MEDTTLYIRNLPSSFTVEEKINFLMQYGANNVRCMPNFGRLRHSAFASFTSKEIAECALHRLHQLEISGHRLIVQFAKPYQSTNFPQQTDTYGYKKSQQDQENAVKNEKDILNKKIEEFTKQLNAIAPHLGVNYPPSPLLKYKYPPPTPTIIANISHSLAAVPKFYTQVLHLMNKMNMPAPFGQLTQSPPLQPDRIMTGPDTYIEEEMDVMTSEESEYQSEEDEREKSRVKEQPVKRPTKIIKKRIKRPKLQKIVPVNIQSNLQDSERIRAEPSEVFEMVDFESKKIQFKIKTTEETIPETHETIVATEPSEIIVETGGFGTLEPQLVEEIVTKDDEDDEEMWQGVKFVSLSDLERNRISSKDIKTHSAFKKYSPGEMTYRLYIKNLANQVDDKDLLSIYGRYVNRKNEAEKNMFDIRLMKEGRMKGQAFVTLANEEQAAKALKDTHGYLLKGKPLVVQFARSARPKEDKQTKKD